MDVHLHIPHTASFPHARPDAALTQSCVRSAGRPPRRKVGGSLPTMTRAPHRPRQPQTWGLQPRPHKIKALHSLCPHRLLSHPPPPVGAPPCLCQSAVYPHPCLPASAPCTGPLTGAVLRWLAGRLPCAIVPAVGPWSSRREARVAEIASFRSSSFSRSNFRYQI